MIQDTSRQAAERNAPWAPTQRELIFAHLQCCGERGATDEQIQLATGMLTQSETARRRSLVETGHVADSGRTRKNSRGESCTVWVLTGKPLHDTRPPGPAGPVQLSLFGPQQRPRPPAGSPPASPPARPSGQATEGDPRKMSERAKAYAMEREKELKQRGVSDSRQRSILIRDELLRRHVPPAIVDAAGYPPLSPTSHSDQAPAAAT